MIPIVKTYRRNPIYVNRLLNDEYCGGKMEHYDQRVNVIESEESYTIDLAAPGFERDELKVTIDNNKLTIASSVEEDRKKVSTEYLRKEFQKKTFSRTFELPENVDSKKIEASHKNGILSIAIAKQAKVEIPVQEIEVK